MGADQLIGAVGFVGYQTLESQGHGKRLSSVLVQGGSRIVASGAGDCADVHLVPPNL
jgi:hypothetical protein